MLSKHYGSDSSKLGSEITGGIIRQEMAALISVWSWGGMLSCSLFFWSKHSKYQNKQWDARWKVF